MTSECERELPAVSPLPVVNDPQTIARAEYAAGCVDISIYRNEADYVAGRVPTLEMRRARGKPIDSRLNAAAEYDAQPELQQRFAKVHYCYLAEAEALGQARPRSGGSTHFDANGVKAAETLRFASTPMPEETDPKAVAKYEYAVGCHDPAVYANESAYVAARVPVLERQQARGASLMTRVNAATEYSTRADIQQRHPKKSDYVYQREMELLGRAH